MSPKGKAKIIRSMRKSNKKMNGIPPIYKHYGVIDTIKEIKKPFTKKQLKKLRSSRYKR